jgi:hypothetical protein
MIKNHRNKEVMRYGEITGRRKKGSKKTEKQEEIISLPNEQVDEGAHAPRSRDGYHVER